MNPLSRSTAIVLALAASLLLNIALLATLYVGFTKLQLARIFPIDTVDAEATAFTSPGARPMLVIIGDSRALQWRARTLAQCFDVANYAVGGHTSSQARLRLEKHLPPRDAWVLVQFGINDLHPLGGFPKYADQIAGRLITNIKAVTELLQRNGNKIILTTIIGPGRIPLWRWVFWDRRTPQYIAQANAEIRALADHDSVFLLDAAAILDDESGSMARQYQDADFFLHLNTNAYAVLNSKLAALIVSAANSKEIATCLAQGSPR